MSKTIEITDNTPLYDGKLFLIEMNSVAGVVQTAIVRKYKDTTDDIRELLEEDDTKPTLTAFEAGESVLVCYDQATLSYRIVNLKAKKAVTTQIVSNGFAKAGYLQENKGAPSDYAENFIIPTGLVVGSSSAGSKGNVTAINGFVTGDFASPMKIQQISDYAIAVGDTLNDAQKGGFFGYGSELGPYVKGVDAGPGDLVYTSESSVTGGSIFFDGKQTFLVGSTQSEQEEGDYRIIDLIDDDLATIVGRYRATLVLHAGNLNWVVEGNLTPLIVSANYTAGVIPSNFNNSFSIGNNAYLTANNQIRLGTVGLNGQIVTDYDIVTTGTLAGSFDELVANRFTNVPNDPYTPLVDLAIVGDISFNGYDNGAQLAFTCSAENIRLGSPDTPVHFMVDYDATLGRRVLCNMPFQSSSVTDKTLTLEGIENQTASILAISAYASSFIPLEVKSDGEVLCEAGLRLSKNAESGAGHINVLSNVQIGFDGSTVLTVDDGEVIVDADATVYVNSMAHNGSGQIDITGNLTSSGIIAAPQGNFDSIKILTFTPASAAAVGVAGTFAWDTSYIYVCTATNTWKRAALATW